MVITAFSSSKSLSKPSVTIPPHQPKSEGSLFSVLSTALAITPLNVATRCRILGIWCMLIIEAEPDTRLEDITERMGRTPPWADRLILRADGYCTPFYKKD